MRNVFADSALRISSTKDQSAYTTLGRNMRTLLTLVVSLSLGALPVVAAPWKETPVYPGSVFVGFGENADGAKKVTVGGGVLHAGEY